MPESPEIRIYTDQLSSNFSHLNLLNLEVLGGRYLKDGILDLEKIKFPLHNISFNCRGKFMYWQFDEDPIFFLTAGLTGSFSEKQEKHSAIKFTFNQDKVLYYNDIRRFGSFKIVFDKEILKNKLASLYWDVLQEPIPQDITDRIRKYANKTIAEVLMEQKINVGIGNYLKNEACYRAKILPTRLIKDLSDQEINLLYEEVIKVVKFSYELGGATIKDFKDLNGNSGKFFDQFQIYGKKIDPLGNPVKKITTKDKRTSFYVEEVQK